MTITITAETRAWLSAKLPNIRVAVPALRCKTASNRTGKSGAAKRALEQQFREDFKHLSDAKARSKTAPKTDRFASFRAPDMPPALQRAA